MQVFITRDLNNSSPFFSILTARGWTVQGQSLVQLTPLPFSVLPASDWIFFSSQHAVRFFFQTIEEQQLEVPETRWAALGKATSATLNRFVEKVDFTGTGDPFTSAEAFIPLCAGQTVLFPGARHSRQTIRQQLAPVAKILLLEVYDNVPIAEPPQIDAGVLVFTSPMNVQAYFPRFSLQKGQKVVAIGPTTAAALQESGIPDMLIASEPTEQALAEAIISLHG